MTKRRNFVTLALFVGITWSDGNKEWNFELVPSLAEIELGHFDANGVVSRRKQKPKQANKEERQFVLVEDTLGNPNKRYIKSEGYKFLFTCNYNGVGYLSCHQSKFPHRCPARGHYDEKENKFYRVLGKDHICDQTISD